MKFLSGELFGALWVNKLRLCLYLCFLATSASIQKLEEELGASIENEDTASLSTLTESKEFNSQTKSKGLEAKNTEQDQVMQQKTGEDINQCKADTSTNQGSDHSMENTTSQASEANDNAPFSSNKSINRTVEAEAITGKVLGTANMSQIEQGTYETVETDDISNKEYICDKSQTAGTSDRTQELDTGDTTETVDTSDRTQTVDIGDITETVDTSDRTQTVDTGDITETVDTRDRTQTADAVGTTEIVDTNDRTQTVHTGGMAETVDRHVGTQTVHVDAGGTTETVDTSDKTDTRR